MTDHARITGRFEEESRARQAAEGARARGLSARREVPTPIPQATPSYFAVLIGGTAGLVLGCVGGALAYGATGFMTPDPGKLVDHGGMFLVFVTLGALTLGATGALVGLAFGRRRRGSLPPTHGAGHVVHVRAPRERVDEARALLDELGASGTQVA